VVYFLAEAYYSSTTSYFDLGVAFPLTASFLVSSFLVSSMAAF
jgi:hypothetical protein